KNNRRAFLKLSLGAGALVGLPAPLLGYTPSLADPKQQASNPIVEIPIYVYQPFLQSHFDNTMHISWFSILPAAAYVCYGDSADNLNLKAYPEYKFGLQAANTNFHQVILKNLEPGKKYYYQVVTKGIKE